jgi:hypothetical protein
MAAHTAYDVLQAVGQYNDFDLEAASFRQLQPVAPQRPQDVQRDTAYFVNDVGRLACVFSGMAACAVRECRPGAHQHTAPAAAADRAAHTPPPPPRSRSRRPG